MPAFLHLRSLQRIAVWGPAPPALGGIQTYTRQLVRALREASPTTDVQLVPLLPRSPVSFLLRSAAQAMRQRPDLIWVTHLHLAPWARLVAAILRCDYWVSAHGIEAWSARSPWHEAALRHAARVCPVSRETAQRLGQRGVVDPERLSLLPNVVDSVRFKPGPRPPNLLRRYGLAPGQRVILTLSRLVQTEPYKGIDEALAAFAQIARERADTHYILAGAGDAVPRLRRQMQALGLAGRVTLPGRIAESELAEHYRLADIFLLPSAGEGFGLVYLEALACDCAVIAQNSGGTPDALNDGAWGRLVPPDDLPALVAALREELDRSRTTPARAPAIRTSMLARFGSDALSVQLSRWGIGAPKRAGQVLQRFRWT